MQKLTVRHLCMLGLSVLGAAILGGCADMASHNVYRTYYHDGHCRIFYVDASGQRVYDGKFNGRIDFVGLKLMRDANGRYYYQDSFGNRIYQVRMCDK